MAINATTMIVLGGIDGSGTGNAGLYDAWALHFQFAVPKWEALAPISTTAMTCVNQAGMSLSTDCSTNAKFPAAGSVIDSTKSSQTVNGLMFHSAVFVKPFMIVFGGCYHTANAFSLLTSVLADPMPADKGGNNLYLYAYPAAGQTGTVSVSTGWTKLKLAYQPEQRWGHTATVFQECFMIVHGGYSTGVSGSGSGISSSFHVFASF